MIAGHESIKKLFSFAAKHGALAHAYLFYGPESIGKKAFALDLAQSLNKTKGFDADFKFLGGRIGIEEIRDLKKFFAFKPYINPWKIAVIDNAYQMTIEAQNALLKLLEEPSAHSLIILIAHDPSSVLSVIRSRCQLIAFRPLSSNNVRNVLMSKGMTTEDLEFVISMANGRIGYALRLAEGENVSSMKKEIEIFRKMPNAPLSSRFNYAKKLVLEDRVDTTLYYWIGYLRGALGENRTLLKRALRLNEIISHTSYNKRLAVENFLIHV